MTTRKLWALGLFALAAVGCGEDDKKDDEGTPGGGECPSTLSYEKTAEPFVNRYCVSCHGADVTGTARMGAPEEHDFGTRALLEANGHHTVERVSMSDTDPLVMPPKRGAAPQPTAKEREEFLEWMDCSGTGDMGEHDH